MSQSPDLTGPYVNGPQRPLLVSLYSQKDRHIYMQRVIACKQQKVLEESREQPYIATDREKKTELAVLEAHKQAEEKIAEVYCERSGLYNKLERKLGRNDAVDLSISDSSAQWLVFGNFYSDLSLRRITYFGTLWCGL